MRSAGIVDYGQKILLVRIHGELKVVSNSPIFVGISKENYQMNAQLPQTGVQAVKECGRQKILELIDFPSWMI